MTDGEKLKAAIEAWMASEEGIKCRDGTASGVYLYNRLWRAFDAGWEAAKRPSSISTNEG